MKTVLEQAKDLAAARLRIVYEIPQYQTRRARLEGPAGERHEMACAVCREPVVVGDQVYVTVAGGVVHAIAHAPDCVEALRRKGAPAR